MQGRGRLCLTQHEFAVVSGGGGVSESLSPCATLLLNCSALIQPRRVGHLTATTAKNGRTVMIYDRWLEVRSRW